VALQSFIPPFEPWMACSFLIESVKDNSLFRIECGQFEDISRPDFDRQGVLPL